MKGLIHISSMMMFIFLLSGCTEFNTKRMDEVAEEVIQDDVIDEEEIADESIPLGNPLENTSGFELGKFTNLGNAYISEMNKDIESNLLNDDHFEEYSDLATVASNDLMAVINVELEYLMQFDKGFWTNREVDYPNGNGVTISSFALEDDVYSYEITYRDTTGSYKDVYVTYNELLDRYDYHSQSYNNDGELSYVVKQQFARADEGAYYYQAMRHSILDDMERASFSYFDDQDYVCYAKTNSNGIKLSEFLIDLFEEVPNDHEDMIRGYASLSYMKRNTLGFSYEFVD